MSRDIFGNMPSNVPKSDSRIIRVDFEENEMGARKGFVPRLPKNNQPIVHVTTSRRGEG